MTGGRTRREFLTAAATGMVTVGATGTAGAERTEPGRGPAPERRVLFDTRRELVGSLPLDGHRRYIYRYENRLPAASGVEVWGPERRMTDPKQVERTFEKYGWVHTVETLLGREPRIDAALSTVLDRARTIENRAEEPKQVLEWVLDRIDDVRDISISIGTISYNAWDILTKVYPTAGTMASAIESVHGRLEGWVDATRSARTALPALVEYLDATDDPERIDPARAKERVRNARSGLRELRGEANGLLGDVEAVEESADEMLTKVNQSADEIIEQVDARTDIPISTVAGLAKGKIDQATRILREVIDRLFDEVVDPLLSPVRTLTDRTSKGIRATAVEPPASARAKSLRKAWNQRRNAGTAVGVVTAGTVLIGVLILASTWSEPMVEPGEFDD